MNMVRFRLKKAWHEATFMNGAQTDCAKHLFDAIHEALKQMPKNDDPR